MIAGRYRLERQIGRGGSGTVHLALDEVLGRQVAIKRIGLIPGSDSAELERAEREARLAAALNHPHVVSVFDLVDEEDVRWLVMEYVDGQTLSERVRTSGALDATEAATLLAQTADALVEAHDHGIVHRDVKPSNIMIAGGAAKLNDFGIARSEDDHSLTQTGLVTGSPAYLAPEVASGSSATPASDVWSLGATLYHAVTGKPPYDVGDNLIGALYKIVHEDPPRLPDDHPMAGLLTVMMNRDVEARWTMPRVRDELARIARGQRSTVVPAAAPAPTREVTGVLPPVQAGPPAAPAPRHGARWGWLAAAAVLAVAAVVAAYVWAGRGTPEALPDEQQARSAETSETTDRQHRSPGHRGGHPRADGRLHHLLPRHRHERPPSGLRPADARVPAGQRRLRGLHGVVGPRAVGVPGRGRQRPVGPDGRLHRRLRDEDRRAEHRARAAPARAVRRPAPHRRRGVVSRTRSRIRRGRGAAPTGLPGCGRRRRCAAATPTRWPMVLVPPPDRNVPDWSQRV